jgi:Ca2+-binding RTX toxin-like protein
MRRSALLLATIALTLLVASGVALAKTINCNGGLCFGTNNSDSIYGSNRHDTIFAKKGGDFVSGRGRADDLNGGDGNDSIFGGWGDDWVKGGRHDDMVKGDLGNDRITGGSGHNVIRAGDGMRDLIVCGDHSRNLIYFDPRLDRFSNCVFLHKSVQETSSRGSTVSVVGLGRSRSPDGATR